MNNLLKRVVLMAVLLLPTLLAEARSFAPVPQEVRALRKQVPQLRQEKGSTAVLAMLDPIVLDATASDELRRVALDLYAQELLKAGVSPDPLRSLRQRAQGEWRYRIDFRYWVLVVEFAKTPDLRIAQLLQIAENGGSSRDDRALRRWAAQHLCSSGVASAWPIIKAAYSDSRYDQDDLAFCRYKIKALIEFSDPILGLRELLMSEDPLDQTFQGGALHSWAANQLDQMGTTRSLHLLAEYGARLSWTNWYGSRDIADQLKKHGFTEKTLAAYGFRDSPGSRRGYWP